MNVRYVEIEFIRELLWFFVSECAKSGYSETKITELFNVVRPQ
jgi:hypothetical protein